MITRIVKLSLAKGNKTAFINLFKQSRPYILNFNGCRSVELKSLASDPDIVFTVSTWTSEAALEAYRASDFFASTWKAVKPLFAAKAEAWTLSDQPV